MSFRPALYLSAFALVFVMPGTNLAGAGQVTSSTKCEASSFTGSWGF